MLDLRDNDGNLLRTLGGVTLDEACHTALVEYGAPETIAMLPAATRGSGVFMIWALARDGGISNTGMRLEGQPG